MEFLKEILGDQYQEFEIVLNAYNANPKNKPIKLKNIGSGEYVGKGKYEKLVTKKDQLETQIKSLNTTMETLEKEDKVNVQLQNTITTLNEDMKKLKHEIMSLVTTCSAMEECIQSILLGEYLK